MNFLRNIEQQKVIIALDEVRLGLFYVGFVFVFNSTGNMCQVFVYSDIFIQNFHAWVMPLTASDKERIKTTKHWGGKPIKTLKRHSKV